MARISHTIAAATLALAISAPLAHAQMGSAVPPGNSMGSSGMPGGTSGSMGSGNMGSGSATQGSGMTGMHHGSGMHGNTTANERPMGSPSTYGMGGMTGQGSGSAAAPTQPMAGVQLPQQQGVGNGAYNGGGVVLEHLPDGTTRVVR